MMTYLPGQNVLVSVVFGGMRSTSSPVSRGGRRHGCPGFGSQSELRERQGFRRLTALLRLLQKLLLLQEFFALVGQYGTMSSRLVLILTAVVAIMAASTLMPKPVYAPGGMCSSCFARVSKKALHRILHQDKFSVVEEQAVHLHTLQG